MPTQAPDGMTFRTFPLRAETIDEKTRSVEAVIATETPVAVYDWARDEVVDEVIRMDGLELPKDRQLVLLDAHARWSSEFVLGSTRDLRVEDGKLIGRNVFSSEPGVDPIWTKVREGHIRDNSIGYLVTEHTTIGRGEKAVVKGTEYTASATRALRIATRVRPRENSIVPIGADALAKMRSEWLRGGTMPDTVTPPIAAPPAPQPERADKPPTAPPQSDANALREEAIRSERVRAKAINDAARDDKGEMIVPAELAQRMIDEGKSIQEAREAFLDHIRKGRVTDNTKSPALPKGDDETREREALSDAVLARNGIFPEDARRKARANDERHMTLLDVCRRSLRLEGRDVPSDPTTLATRAFSTTTLPSVLGNLANKTIMQSFMLRQPTAFQWCGINDQIPNFQTITRTRLGELGPLQNAKDGEIQHGELTERKEQYALNLKGQMLRLTIVDIINDDLGAFNALARMLGERARITVDDDTYAHLIANGNMSDSVALFHATSHGANLLSGGSSALSVSSLATAKKTMRLQKGTDNATPLNIEPAFLIVGPTLETTARQLVESQVLVSTTTANAPLPATNIFYQSMRVVVEPRIETLSGGSSTAWYLAAAPPNPTIELGFLRAWGAGPRVEEAELTGNLLGREWRVYMAFAPKALDWRGLVKSAGA